MIPHSRLLIIEAAGHLPTMRSLMWLLRHFAIFWRYIMDNALFELLRSVDTPTVCNAIETAQGKRGFNDYTRGTVLLCARTSGHGGLCQNSAYFGTAAII